MKQFPWNSLQYQNQEVGASCWKLSRHNEATLSLNIHSQLTRNWVPFDGFRNEGLLLKCFVIWSCQNSHFNQNNLIKGMYNFSFACLCHLECFLQINFSHLTVNTKQFVWFIFPYNMSCSNSKINFTNYFGLISSFSQQLNLEWKH